MMALRGTHIIVQGLSGSLKYGLLLDIDIASERKQYQKGMCTTVVHCICIELLHRSTLSVFNVHTRNRKRS
jgi:hypothetical protein